MLKIWSDYGRDIQKRLGLVKRPYRYVFKHDGMPCMVGHIASNQRLADRWLREQLSEVGERDLKFVETLKEALRS